MINTIEEALYQNQLLVNECFLITQKYESSEKELNKCRQQIKELKAIMGKACKEDEEPGSKNQLLESQKLLNEMKEKNIDDAKTNKEFAKKIKAMEDFLAVELEKKNIENSVLRKEIQDKGSIIERLTQDIEKLENEYKQLPKTDISKWKQSSSGDDNHQGCLQELRKRDIWLNVAHGRIMYLSQKAEQWYHLFQDQRFQLMRLQRGIPNFLNFNFITENLSLINAQFAAFFIEANDRIFNLTEELKSLKASKNSLHE